MRLSAVYTYIRLFNWINRSRCPGDQEGPEEEVKHSDIGWFSSACAGREEGWEGREGSGAHSTYAVCFHFTFAALRCRIRGDYHHDKITCTHGMAYGQNSFIRCEQWDLAMLLRKPRSYLRIVANGIDTSLSRRPRSSPMSLSPHISRRVTYAVLIQLSGNLERSSFSPQTSDLSSQFPRCVNVFLRICLSSSQHSVTQGRT